MVAEKALLNGEKKAVLGLHTHFIMLPLLSAAFLAGGVLVSQNLDLRKSMTGGAIERDACGTMSTEALMIKASS